MKQKYPIGTICKLGICPQKIMIIGYFINSYEKGLMTYDYEGCIYPFGTLSNKKILFNEGDIVDIIFEGYKNYEYESFLDKSSNISNDHDDIKTEVKEDFFQEITTDGEMTLIQNTNYNKLLVDKDGNILIADER